MKKPWAVRIVEALGWLYIILVVIFMGVSLFYYMSKGDFPEAAMSGVSFLCFLALPAAMVLALRQGRRAWFVWPHTLIVLVVLMVSVAIPAAAAAIVALILLACPIVLLFLPEASLWFHEMSIDRKHDRFGGWAAAMLCVLLVLAGCVMYMSRSAESGFANASAMVCREQALYGAVVKNGMCRDAGDAHVDPSEYANSVDFIQALGAEYRDAVQNLGRYTNIWCVVVNPPDDDRFTVLFTANVSPSDVLGGTNDLGHEVLTCPKQWGGECFDVCEKMACVMTKGGAARTVKGKYVNWVARTNKELAHRDTIHVLTPTGRVAVVFAPLSK